MRRLRVLLLFATSAHTSTFSYHQAWPRHFQASPLFECRAVNVAGTGWAARLAALAAIATWRGDLVVILHSVFSNACLLEGRLFDAVARLSQPKAYFIGNEYKLMPEKMAFCEALAVRLLVSQSHSAAVHQLYRQRLGCEVTALPNTGYDPALFAPVTPDDERPIDLGYRADDVPVYLGHNERREIAGYFQARAARFGLTVDISLDPRDRFSEPQWAAFLNRCKGQLGTEAGGDYFTLDDDRRLAAMAYERDHPEATTAEVMAGLNRLPKRGVPLRILSGRHVEAAGTCTAQLLFEGEYDGYFTPDRHYIALKKDFSNADDAVRKFKDVSFRRRVAQQAYELVRAEFTYDHLLSRFAAAAAAIMSSSGRR